MPVTRILASCRACKSRSSCATAAGCSPTFRPSNSKLIFGSALCQSTSAEPKMSFEFEGRKVGLHPASVARLDRDLQALHDPSMRVTIIPLNYFQTTTPRTSPYVYPLTHPKTIPAGPAADNTATPKAVD